MTRKPSKSLQKREITGENTDSDLYLQTTSSEALSPHASLRNLRCVLVGIEVRVMMRREWKAGQSLADWSLVDRWRMHTPGRAEDIGVDRPVSLPRLPQIYWCNARHRRTIASAGPSTFRDQG